MKPLLKITDRDHDILRFLTLRVRIAELTQIARTWWPRAVDAPDIARRRLHELRTVDLVQSQQVMVLQSLALLHPLCQWSPGEPPPNFGRVAWLLHHRTTGRRVAQRVYLATTRAAHRFGGARSGRIAQPFQVAHDLGVTEMYLALLKTRPELALQWIDEDRLAPYRRRQKLPDAIIAVHPSALPQLVLEYGGDYGKRRLLDFHEDNRERGLPYEIW